MSKSYSRSKIPGHDIVSKDLHRRDPPNGKLQLPPIDYDASNVFCGDRANERTQRVREMRALVIVEFISDVLL